MRLFYYKFLLFNLFKNVKLGLVIKPVLYADTNVHKIVSAIGDTRCRIDIFGIFLKSFKLDHCTREVNPCMRGRCQL